MTESLSDRLKRLASERSLERSAEQDARASQVRADEFISGNAKSEFLRLQTTLKSLIEEVNSSETGLPKFQIYPNGMIQQGNYVSFQHFDMPFFNSSENRLTLTLGPHPNAMYFSTEPLDTLRFELHAGCDDSFEAILWRGELGDLTTKQLSEIVLETMTNYYLEHSSPH